MVYVVLSPGYLASFITQAVADATGREVSIASGPRISLWPKPAIRLKGITISNPPGAAQGVLASAEAMEIRMSFGALLHSLWWNGNPERTNTILGRQWQHLYGPDAVREQFVPRQLAAKR